MADYPAFPDLLDLVHRVRRPDLAPRTAFEVDEERFQAAFLPIVAAVAAGADYPELAAGMPTLRAMAEQARGDRQAAVDVGRRFVDYALHHRYPDADGIAIRYVAPKAG